MIVASQFYSFVLHTEIPTETLVNLMVLASVWDIPVDNITLDYSIETDLKIFARFSMEALIGDIIMRHFSQLPEIKKVETKMGKRTGCCTNGCKNCN